jgi:hypothetical protein
VTREEAEVKWVIRNAVDEGEMGKQDEAPKNGEDIKKELPAEADITDDPEDDGSSVEDDREHFFQEEGFEDTKDMKDSSLRAHTSLDSPLLNQRLSSSSRPFCTVCNSFTQPRTIPQRCTDREE